MSGKTARKIISPYDGELVGEVSFASYDHLTEAIAAAEKAYGVFSSFPAHKISAYLSHIQKQLQEKKDMFAKLIALEAGKPIKYARMEVDRAIHTFEIAAREAWQLYGMTLPMDHRPWGENRWAQVERFPIGVIGSITPFNFPLNLVAHKLGPAVASRNTLVHKPAPLTPLTSLRLAECCDTDLVPPGTINVVPCDNEAAAALVKDPRIKLLTFTGSASVGWDIKRQAYQKKVCLELGGNSAAIIHSDARLDDAMTACARGAFSFSGQSCISVQRIFVEKSRFDEAVQELIRVTKTLKAGNPLEEDTDIGPMISSVAADRVMAWVQEAVSRGAVCLLGNERLGNLIYPTILTRTTAEMKVNCEEIFGPVVTIEPYSSFEEAIRRTNDSAYGLQAGVFTQDVDRIRYAYRTLQVGGVIINDAPTWRMDHMPYGGMKRSGNTKEGVRYTMEEMTEAKLLAISFLPYPPCL